MLAKDKMIATDSGWYQTWPYPLTVPFMLLSKTPFPSDTNFKPAPSSDSMVSSSVSFLTISQLDWVSNNIHDKFREYDVLVKLYLCCTKLKPWCSLFLFLCLILYRYRRLRYRYVDIHLRSAPYFHTKNTWYFGRFFHCFHPLVVPDHCSKLGKTRHQLCTSLLCFYQYWMLIQPNVSSLAWDRRLPQCHAGIYQLLRCKNFEDPPQAGCILPGFLPVRKQWPVIGGGLP